MEKSLTVDLLIEKVGKNSRDGKCIVRAILRAGLEKKDADLLIQAYPYIDPRAMIKGVRKGKMRVLRDQVGKKIWLACRDKDDEQALRWIRDNVSPHIKSRTDSPFTILELVDEALAGFERQASGRKATTLSYPA
jgi:hypothetical protein